MNELMASSNVIKKEKLRKIQQWVLEDLKDALLPSAGCFGSTTQILRGDPSTGVYEATQYSKDGHTILSNIKYDRAIEASIQSECSDMTRYIVKEVGDGTTSTIILSSLIFDALLEIDLDKYPPHFIIDTFRKIVDEVREVIMNNGRELQLDDIYNIAMICTNSNKKVSSIITDIYKEHGLDVFIDVAPSITDHDVIKTYDGLTIGVGYSDPCYINSRPVETEQTKSDETQDLVGQSIIRNARVYAFQDPIDTIEMHNFFNKIVMDNIMLPMRNFMNAPETEKKEAWQKVIPTVILAPKISLDMNQSFREIVEYMYRFNETMEMKPPLLVVTNIGEVNAAIYADIWQLCKCKPIKKYIDPEIQKKEIEDGKAPTMDTVTEFGGFADEVKADGLKTTFINPVGMFALDEDENYIMDEDGNRTYSQTYKGLLEFLEQELTVAIENNETITTIGNLKRRIHSLKANMVDYFVGGLTVTDRDSVRDLVEDAVKNIRSASVDGVGYGTNFEGLRASNIIFNKYMEKDKEEGRETESFDTMLAGVIYKSYYEMSKILYNTVYYDDEKYKLMGVDCKAALVDQLISKSLEVNCPMNFTTYQFDKSVLCTIKQDAAILEVIAKIITIMFASNQALLQDSRYNIY